MKNSIKKFFGSLCKNPEPTPPLHTPPLQRDLAVGFEATENDKKIIEIAQPYTLTSRERLWALINSVRYILDNNIQGDFCECGVWKGGSLIAMILKLKEQDSRRQLWAYDTFTGMNMPTEADISCNDAPAMDRWQNAVNQPQKWCEIGLHEVKSNITATTQWPEVRCNFIKGPVEETLRDSGNLPEKLSLLRLDTDFYESTAIEMEILYPRLVCGGVLIIDDYGHWKGARKAVDEYLKKQQYRPLLNRIDYTGRLCIKME